ncbi:MAG: serine/threonine protein kinase [Elusimicrobiales bacterium]|nr:serine/threonine protein kinase [Elusimicrobiales bacterium]
MTEQDTLLGTTFAGCEILEKIGQGGMGAVYKARLLTLDKIVCIKILAPDLSKDSRNIDFFLREARSVAKLEHPNIVQVYNFGQEGKAYYIIMSYINGKSLDAIIKEKGAFSIEKASDILISVLEGLEHAHSKTIIHRDIKPANILLDQTGKAKIVDFGLARSVNEEKELTMAGEMIGTAYFMSPEQGLAAKVDHRADLYSIGATYFYLITGKYPFDGKSSIDVIHKHISEPLPNIVRILPEVPLWVSRILEKSMSKKVEDRYQTASELKDALIKYKNPENSKILYSSEISIDIPELTARITNEKKEEPKESSLEKSEPRTPATTSLKTSETFKTPIIDNSEKPLKPKLQLVLINDIVKVSLHFSLTATLIAIFILVGCLPAKEMILTDNLQTFFGPLLNNPMKSIFFILAGLGLMFGAIYVKPKKLTFFHAIAISLIALFSYIAGSLALVPGSFDMITKTVFVLNASMENLFAKNNIIPYAVFCLILGSALSMKLDWKLKITGIILSVFSVNLTYRYFMTDLYTAPDHLMLGLTLASLFIGVIVSLGRKNFSVLINPALFFLISNLLIFFVLSGPQITLLIDKVAKEDQIKVWKLQTEESERQASIIPEFDFEGNPIIKKDKTILDAIKPASPSELKRLATKRYYAILLLSFKEIALKTGGFLIISLLLLIMVNIIFVNELLVHHKEKRYIQ